MKKKMYLLLLLAFVGLCAPAKAVLVNIPDANFRARLQAAYPACFVGAQMETTCAGAIITSLNVAWGNITNLSGIEHLTSLALFNCSNNQLAILPTLPASLRSLTCSNNQLTVLPTLPASLQYLSCSNNQLTVLPTLPVSLQDLTCSYNQLSVLPTLPISLQDLTCDNNQLTVLPTLPANLRDFNCNFNLLTTLPTLPANLRDMNCSNNQLATLPTLPTSLRYLSCYFNQLSVLPTLPASLQLFYCNNNQLDFADLEIINPMPSNYYNANPQNYKILPITQTLTSGAMLTINGTIGGSLNLYQWYKNSNIISGATNAIFSIPSIATTDAGVYLCRVTSTYVGLGSTTGVAIMGGVTITVCPTISITTSLPNTSVGSTYSETITQIGLTGTPVWSVSTGTLPNGLSLASNTGIISGTPTVAGTSNFTIQVSNGVCSQTKAFSIVVACPAISINNISLADGVGGSSYAQTLLQTGLTGALTWSISAGTLPAGLSLASSTGIISGTPTVAGTSNFTIQVNSGTCLQTKGFSIMVVCATISITNGSLVDGVGGSSYAQTLLQTGIISSSIWSVSIGNLPNGLSLASTTGIIMGVPTVAGTFNFTIQVESGICSQTKAFSITVAKPLVIINSPASINGVVSTIYNKVFTQTGLTGAVTWSVSEGTLPAGLTLNVATGVVSGTPTIANTFNFTIKVSNGIFSEEKAYVLIIEQNPTTALDNSLSNLVKISPNPSNGDFNIDFSGLNVAKSLVRVYDTQGKQVLSSEISTNTNTISLKNMPNGIYLLEIETSKGRILKRLAKN